MAYLKINDNDYSNLVKELVIKKSVNYNAQTNAAGDTVVDYINSKRNISVKFIPMNADDMVRLQTDLDKFSVSITFLNPQTNLLVENVPCIIPNNDADYYTIQSNRVLYKEFSLEFIEL